MINSEVEVKDGTCMMKLHYESLMSVYGYGSHLAYLFVIRPKLQYMKGMQAADMT